MSASSSKAELRAIALATRDALSDEQRAAAAQAVAKRALPFEITPGHDRLRLFADPQRDRSGAADAKARRAGREAGAAGGDGARQVAGVSGLVARRPADAGPARHSRAVAGGRRTHSRHHAGAAGGVRSARATASAMAPGITTTRSRICARSKAVTAVGIAFAAQEIEAVPALAHDVALDYVLTETRRVRFPELSFAYSFRR